MVMTSSAEGLVDKVRSGERISLEDARILATSTSLETLQMLATSARDRLHPKGEATYLHMSIINTTNVCVAKCSYCSFYRLPQSPDTYTLSFDEIVRRIEALRAVGGAFVAFNGGFHPDLGIEHYADLFSRLRDRYGETLGLYGMTVAEFLFASRVSRMSLREAAKTLHASGCDWIPGGGAEVLSPSFRARHSPGKFTVAQYLSAQKEVLDAGLGSTATMVIGFDETLGERLEHLGLLREFQDESGRLLPSLLVWTYKPYGNALGGAEISGEEYHRWLAVCRIFLDNIEHLRTSVLTQNEAGIRGLLYGANDFDLPVEDEVTQKAGAVISHDFEAILDGARAVGMQPRLRLPFPLPGRGRQVPIAAQGTGEESHSARR